MIIILLFTVKITEEAHQLIIAFLQSDRLDDDPVFGRKIRQKLALVQRTSLLVEGRLLFRCDGLLGPLAEPSEVCEIIRKAIALRLLWCIHALLAFDIALPWHPAFFQLRPCLMKQIIQAVVFIQQLLISEYIVDQLPLRDSGLMM